MFSNRRTLCVASILAVLLCAAPPALATVSLTISDNDATPGSRVVGAGEDFSFTVRLVSTSEQTSGIDYYLTSLDGNNIFSITNRNTAGSNFVDPLYFNDTTVATPPSSVLDPRNDHDLGGLSTVVNNAGNFLVANFTMHVAAGTPNGTYRIQTTVNVPSEGWLDGTGGEHPFASHGLFTVSVPEPGSAIAVAGLLAAGAAVRRRRRLIA